MNYIKSLTRNEVSVNFCETAYGPQTINKFQQKPDAALIPITFGSLFASNFFQGIKKKTYLLMYIYYIFCQQKLGSVGKTRTLHLTHLDSSPVAVSKSPLMDIHTSWFVGLNSSALPGTNIT